jgi:hypothetical protein
MLLDSKIRLVFSKNCSFFNSSLESWFSLVGSHCSSTDERKRILNRILDLFSSELEHNFYSILCYSADPRHLFSPNSHEIDATTSDPFFAYRTKKNDKSRVYYGSAAYILSCRHCVNTLFLFCCLILC